MSRPKPSQSGADDHDICRRWNGVRLDAGLCRGVFIPKATWQRRHLPTLGTKDDVIDQPDAVNRARK